MPAFNEGENLPYAIQECIETLSKLTTKYEIIIIDDCSTDTTNEILANLQQSCPQLRVIHNKHNIGCHPSTMVGFKEAVCDVIIFLPADRQIPPSNISKFLTAIENYDLVCSYRKKRIDTTPRRLASRFYNLILRICFGTNLHDTHSGIAVKQKVARVIASEVQNQSAFAGCEFILRALIKGFRITEIEIEHSHRRAGKAKGANLRDAIRTPIELLRFLWKVKIYKKEHIKTVEV